MSADKIWMLNLAGVLCLAFKVEVLHQTASKTFSGQEMKQSYQIKIWTSSSHSFNVVVISNATLTMGTEMQAKATTSKKQSLCKSMHLHNTDF